MKDAFKKISLIMAIMTILNFILPSCVVIAENAPYTHIHGIVIRGLEAGGDGSRSHKQYRLDGGQIGVENRDVGSGTGESNTIFLGLDDTKDSNGEYIQPAGVYKIQVRYVNDRIPFLITGPDTGLTVKRGWWILEWLKTDLDMTYKNVVSAYKLVDDPNAPDAVSSAPLALATVEGMELKDAASFGEYVCVYLGHSDQGLGETAYKLTFVVPDGDKEVKFGKNLVVDVTYLGNSGMKLWCVGDEEGDDGKYLTNPGEAMITSAIYSMAGESEHTAPFFNTSFNYSETGAGKDDSAEWIDTHNWYRIFYKHKGDRTNYRFLWDDEQFINSGGTIIVSPNVQDLKSYEKHLEPTDVFPDYNAVQEADAPWYEKVITHIIIGSIADVFKGILTALFGNLTIDSLLFNRYDMTRLAFYGNGDNPILASGMMDMISTYYGLFRKLAISFYLVMLLYIGIRIVMKSTAKDKDKYKAMLMDWLTGLVMLFLFPVVIKYMIVFNETLVEYLDESVVQARDYSASGLPTSGGTVHDPQLLIAMKQWEVDTDSDMMMSFRNKAKKTGKLAYALVYIYLLFKLFMFLIFYFKRLITIIFLIVMFPFVAITYAIDKVKDGKAQIFNNWFRELLLNVFTQFFQCAIYIVVMEIISGVIASGTSNVVLLCVGIQFISKSDPLIRSLFPSVLGGGGANTVSPLSQLADTAMAVGAARSILDKRKQIKKAVSGVKETRKKKKKASAQLSIERNRRRHDEYVHQRDSSDLGLSSPTNASPGDGNNSGGGGGAPEGPSGPTGPTGPEEGGPAATEGAGTGTGSPSTGETTNPASRAEQDSALSEMIKGAREAAAHTDQEAPTRKRWWNRKVAPPKEPTKFDRISALLARRALPDKQEETDRAIKAAREEMTDEERAQFDNNMNMQMHLQRALTGQAEDGTRLTDAQISLSVKVVARIVRHATANPDDDTYKDIRDEYLRPDKRVKFKVKKRKSGFATDEEARKYEADNPGKKAFDEYETSRAITDFFGVDEEGNVGRGLVGSVLSDDGRKQLSQSSKLLGKRDGLTGGRNTTQIDNDTGLEGYGEIDSVKEGPDVGVDTVVSLGVDEMETACSDLCTNHLGDDSATVKGTMVANASEGLSLTTAQKGELDEAAGLVMQLGVYNQMIADGSAEGVSSDELFRITDRLCRLQKRNKAVKKLVRTSISTERPGTTDSEGRTRNAVETTMSGLRVNLGVSVQGLRTMAAKTMVTDQRMDEKALERKAKNDKDEEVALCDLAEEVLQEGYERYSEGDYETYEEFEGYEVNDEVSAAVYARSKFDEVFAEDGIDYFEREYGRGLHRDETMTVEEAAIERQKAEIEKRKRERMGQAVREERAVINRNQAAFRHASAVYRARVEAPARIVGTVAVGLANAGANGDASVSQNLTAMDYGGEATSTIASLPRLAVDALGNIADSSVVGEVTSQYTEAQAEQFERVKMVSEVRRVFKDKLTS